MDSSTVRDQQHLLHMIAEIEERRARLLELHSELSDLSALQMVTASRRVDRLMNEYYLLCPSSSLGEKAATESCS